MKLCALLVPIAFVIPPSMKAPVPMQESATTKDPALERIEKSPRHHEWIEIKGKDRPVRCFVASVFWISARGCVGAVAEALGEREVARDDS